MLSRSTLDETVVSAEVSSSLDGLRSATPNRPDAQDEPSQQQVDFESVDNYSPRVSLLNLCIFFVVLAGFLLRLSAAQRLSSHVDESASIMAAHMVADKGVPLFPSGTLYLQGATNSYLLAPMIKLGYGGLNHLTELRMLSV